MKLASLRDGTRDGELIVVSRDLTRAVTATSVAPSLQAALENWASAAPRLRKLYDELNAGRAAGAFTLDVRRLAAPLPRAYQWLDASAFTSHGDLMQKAFGHEPLPDRDTVPLMYQGGSDDFLGPCDDVPLPSEEDGIDFEGEVAVVVDDVPMGTPAGRAGEHIKLLMLVNDVSLRNLIPGELAKGFGFFQSKPASSCSPVAVTPDELGTAWDGGKVNLPLVTHLNGELFGRPNAGVDMNFDFGQLIAHAARTRRLCAGTIIGSGTVSNRDRSTGSSCLAEKRTIETIDHGKPITPFMKFGDRVRIEMFDSQGRSIFGAIDQKIVKYVPRQVGAAA